jgi:hypothetical protein
MKYAIIRHKGRIERIVDRMPVTDSEEQEVIELTTEQGKLFTNKDITRRYVYYKGEFLLERVAYERQQQDKRDEYILNKEKERLSKLTPAQLITEHTHKAAAAAFESLPAGKRAFWEPVRVAVSKAILSGNINDAREILLTLPVMYEGAEAERAGFLSLF